ncbi:hypothetical protein [Roseibacillus ishigakijimensis]|uniref:Uncharacterized protein n=1 Tax=Roseibacillus ishigakijimensis TaxID=454146 RepID=A0A934RM11_9BACT|nr:hypothetical protein [Roseibacillus ishigakijimensis]MBK1834247.1 hypothetical protein [Roseibacillus ishigakijimensis]
MKAFIAFVLFLFFAIGAGVGFYGWKKWTAIEERGVALALAKPVEKDEKEMLEMRYNKILDMDEVLLPTIEAHNLKGFYQVKSDEEALKLFREDSLVKLPGGRDLHVIFKGPRSTREERDAASRTLAEQFVKAASILE